MIFVSLFDRSTRYNTSETQVPWANKNKSHARHKLYSA